MTAIRRPSRRLDTVPQRMLSMGLATATAVGLVGVLAVRSADDAAADTDETTESAPVEVTTTDGLTQADLDNYAAQLETERQRLEDYRNELVAVATDLQAQADALASGSKAPKTVATKVRVQTPKAAAAPKAKPAPKAAAAPKAQAKSKSS